MIRDMGYCVFWWTIAGTAGEYVSVRFFLSGYVEVALNRAGKVI